MTNACECGYARVLRGSTEPMILVCLHCDRPCAGVAGPGRCEACDRMKVKR